MTKKEFLKELQKQKNDPKNANLKKADLTQKLKIQCLWKILLTAKSLVRHCQKHISGDPSSEKLNTNDFFKVLQAMKGFNKKITTPLYWKHEYSSLYHFDRNEKQMHEYVVNIVKEYVDFNEPKFKLFSKEDTTNALVSVS